jgi:hypothetical protein
VVAKTGAAPVERVKLLLQNQAEMLRRGSLTRPYAGIADAFARVLRDEGAAALWRGNQANVIRYFPTQVSLPIQYHLAPSVHLSFCILDWLHQLLRQPIDRCLKSELDLVQTIRQASVDLVSAAA